MSSNTVRYTTQKLVMSVAERRLLMISADATNFRTNASLTGPRNSSSILRLKSHT